MRVRVLYLHKYVVQASSLITCNFVAAGRRASQAAPALVVMVARRAAPCPTRLGVPAGTASSRPTGEGDSVPGCRWQSQWAYQHCWYGGGGAEAGPTCVPAPNRRALTAMTGPAGRGQGGGGEVAWLLLGRPCACACPTPSSSAAVVAARVHGSALPFGGCAGQSLEKPATVWRRVGPPGQWHTPPSSDAHRLGSATTAAAECPLQELSPPSAQRCAAARPSQRCFPHLPLHHRTPTAFPFSASPLPPPRSPASTTLTDAHHLLASA